MGSVASVLDPFWVKGENHSDADPKQLDNNVAEAGLDLGANPWQVLIKVILPQIYPAILSGALIAFSMSFDDL